MSRNESVNSRKIVFVNQATGYLTIDIINRFAEDFDHVALIAGSVRVQDIPLHEKTEWSKIIRYNRGNPLKKLFSWLWGTWQIYWLIRFRFRKYEIFYTSVPPTAYLLSLILPNPFSVLFFDIYPDALKILGISDKHVLFRLWGKWNIKLLERAHRIYTLGDSMQNVLAAYVFKGKIKVIRNWAGIKNPEPLVKTDNLFVKKHNLNGKFIVEYSGNIGHTHNVETLLTVAKLLLDNPAISFLIIGRGNRYKVIEQKIRECSLTNCLLLPFLPDDMIRYSLSAADLSVVILDEKVSGYSIPSKMYNLLAVGSPIMVIGHDHAGPAGFVKENNMGRSFRQHETAQMAEFISELRSDPELINNYTKNALATSKHFTSENATLYLESYLS